MVLNIVSLNVRGLRNEEKRRAIFNFYRDRCTILCLQETHSTIEDEKIWAAEWGGRAFFSHGTNQSRGVLTLVNRKYTEKVVQLNEQTSGRKSQCLVNCEETKMLIVNIYGPNQDSPHFFREVCEQAHENCDKIVIVGDFNVALNDAIDRNTQSANPNPNARAKILAMMNEYQLEDVWRLWNPGVKRFSWYRHIEANRKSPSTAEPKIQASRLDYAIISRGLCDLVHNTFYIPGLKTDHSAYFLGIDISCTDRGPGYWKLNNTHLANPAFVQKINSVIQAAVEELKYLDPVEKWDTLKRRIKDESVKFSKECAKENSVAISQLMEQIAAKEEQISELSPQDMALLHSSKEELDSLVHQKTLGIMFRSKAKWMIEGERNTKYFFNLEKSRYNSKTVAGLLDSKNQIVRDPAIIMDMQKQFYQDLYSADEAISFKLPNIVENTVCDGMTAGAEEQFSENEIYTAIKGMKRNSCPGPDGLPIEFYVAFWSQPGLKMMFIEMMNEVYREGILSPSMRTGVLNLIPKGNKDTRYLKNLRPISLLNSDYKIIEKMIANRMIPALQEIIHEDQKGFLPKRRIQCNIRKILDVVVESVAMDIPCCILSCDFLKCFDRIEFECITKSMEMFKFSQTLVKWVSILYNQFSLRIQNHGHFSGKIQIERSVRQGGPASNAIFLVVVELLAIMLCSDENIEGIRLREVLHLLNQFADDMDVCTEFNQTSIDGILNKFQQFGESTGFQLSYDKTTMYRTGSLRNSNAKLYTSKELNWSNEKICVLGVDIYNCQETTMNENYNSILKKTQDVADSWSNRNLSLCGKITLLNALVASQYIYKLQVLPSPPESFVKRLEGIVSKYLWNGHRPKIPLKILQAAYEDGGMQLFNITHRDISLKCVWVKLVMEGNYSATLVYNVLHPCREMIWTCNLDASDVEKIVCTENIFWKDVLKSWCYYHYSPVTMEGVHDHIIWLNSRIRIQDSPVWWKTPAEAGLQHVSQLYQDKEFISQRRAKDVYRLTVMQYNMLKSAIPAVMKAEVTGEAYTDPKYASFMRAEKAAQHVYWEISTAPEVMRDKVAKIEAETQQDVNIGAEVKWLKSLTVVQKYRSFQYRMLMSAVVTNIQLSKWGIIDTPLCTFCQQYDETQRHLMYDCECVSKVWEAVGEMSEEMGFPGPVYISYRNIILCRISAYKAVNMMSLVAKQYIYRKRCQKEPLNCHELRIEIKRCRSIEKYYAVQNGEMRKFESKWLCI